MRDRRPRRISNAAGDWLGRGMNYAGKTNTLILSSQVHVAMNGPDAEVIDADSGVITHDPHQVVLEHPHLKREDGMLQADHALLYLGSENQVERILADGKCHH